jgi:5'-3' exonuclease
MNVYDYMMISMLLGNDYMPHMIGINLRTNGLEKLKETYEKVKGSGNLVKEKKIEWERWYEYIRELVKKERENIKEEYKKREKMEKRRWSKEECVMNVPIICREKERYICPEEEGWESRYYKIIFGIRKEEEKKKKVKEYKEMLEWVFNYYIGVEKEEKVYKSTHGPLLEDIVKYNEKIELKEYSEKYSEKEKLIYALSYEDRELLGEDGEKKMKEKKKEEYDWCFCRYLWEYDPKLPDIKEMKSIIENDSA